MILQQLNKLYQRLQADPQTDIPAFGYAPQKISFALTIDKNGRIQGDPLDLRGQKGKKSRPREMMLPDLGQARSSNIAPHFLWDKSSYVLGVNQKVHKAKDRTKEEFKAFVKHQREVIGLNPDEGLRAVLNFLDKWHSCQFSALSYHEEITGTNLVFYLEGQGFIHERPAALEIWNNYFVNSGEGTKGQCLISGQFGGLAELHPSIKGVQGGQSSGAALCTYNAASSCSYDKERNLNGPVSRQAAFAYTAALNYLLRFDSAQKINIGSDTLVFWAERPSRAEGMMAAFISGLSSSGKDKKDEDRNGLAEQNKEEQPLARIDDAAQKFVLDALQAIRAGRKLSSLDLDLDDGVEFYLLALSPNASRLAVRFWQVSRLSRLAANLGRYYRELEIVKAYPEQPDFPPLYTLLNTLAVQGKAANLPPRLAGESLGAVLSGRPYPRFILNAALTRIKTEGDIGYYRAALVKAALIRNYKQEVNVSLNPDHPMPAYQLGRLFAVMEGAQKDASGGALNATIRDRYFAAASSNPGRVFPLLLRLMQHHIKKGEHGGRYDRLAEDILNRISDKFPSLLPLEEQGLFSLGYYQQRQDLYKPGAASAAGKE
ncbi:MAG: type I-C CRISPR-associated protein Cas8c/Csd1 [Desulfarculales bacterium]|jgi:CRISPR-associated protein Csd1|nr:type I-C CRISPR-associated protein Cas8c/Csd1 [Desulfarculales bacterium]